MMPEEKAQLLLLLQDAAKWCRDSEAVDANGNDVLYDSADAVAWDLTGALCYLFGWDRACALFVQFDRHIRGRRKAFGWPQRDAAMEAMAELQNFNDHQNTTFEVIRERIETMPAWQGNKRPARLAQEN